MAQKISVVIPNYNGKNLLSKNLPKVITNCPGAEIIVVDDASVDGSVSMLHKKFKKVKTIKLKKNVGFAKAANTGVMATSNDLVLLINSDVAPQKYFLNSTLKYFKDKTTFAVALQDYSHENGNIITKGRGGATFKRGFFNHFPLTLNRGETLWVSGGSGLFSKNKFLQLNGFDQIFKPFYWEDIDLSFRAWKSGYKCYFEPLARVDHFHDEGAIAKQNSKLFIKAVSYKNQFLFVWKNINDVNMSLLHLIWLPYHFAKACLSLDLPFLVGFLWAVSYMPRLIVHETMTKDKFIITEGEVLNKFEKQ